METQNGKTVCDYCDIAFADKEERTKNPEGVFHDTCWKKRTRFIRLHEFFRVNRGQIVLNIRPHGFRRG